MAQHREYTAHHHSVYASDLITKIVEVEVALTLDIHLMRTSLCKARNLHCSGREVVNRPGVLRVALPWHSSNGANDIGGHMDLCNSNPSEK
jgi:hypothetical protein